MDGVTFWDGVSNGARVPLPSLIGVEKPVLNWVFSLIRDTTGIGTVRPNYRALVPAYNTNCPFDVSTGVHLALHASSVQ